VANPGAQKGWSRVEMGEGGGGRDEIKVSLFFSCH